MVYALLACFVEENYKHNIRRVFNKIKTNHKINNCFDDLQEFYDTKFNPYFELLVWKYTEHKNIYFEYEPIMFYEDEWKQLEEMFMEFVEEEDVFKVAIVYVRYEFENEEDKAVDFITCYEKAELK
tara:strand:- start:57 stop:434 length:378 start_codon:yes stop_codon:yes gene_type:complete